MDTGWRRTAARAAAALVLTGGAFPLLQGAAWACSCAAQERDSARYAAYGESETWRSTAAKAGTLYLGEVVRETYVDPDPMLGGEESYEYEVRVVEPLKGSRSGTRTITTPAQGASCGVRLRKGPVLVVDDVAGTCGPTTQERTAPRTAHVRAAVQRRATVHVVRQGESLWKIARTEAAVQSRTEAEPSEARVRQVVQRLKAENPALRRTTVLQPGQRLRVPAL